MNTIDILVYSVLGIVAAFPVIRSAVTMATAYIKARSPSAPSAPDGPTSEENWTQRWSVLLIDLVGELEAMDDKAAASLCRELIWLIIGGEKQGSKK